MTKASWFVALVLGVVIGAVATRMIVGGGGGGGGALPAPSPQLAQPRIPAPAQRGPEDPKALYRVPLEDSPVMGPEDALVTIVISSDFQCPFCRRALPAMVQLDKAYGSRIRFAFKHNPLGFHDKALPAAIAAEEARAQGGDAMFWAMHDALFEASANLDRAALEAAGQKVGLDAGKLRRALDEQKHLQRIRRDQALANSLGATGTPTFFINGRKVVGAVPFETFKTVVDEELAKAEQLVKSGVPASQVYARLVERGATQPVYLPGGAPAPQAAAPAPPAQAAKVPVKAGDPARGPEGAKVTIALFSDFQCPFCSRVDPTLKKLEEAFPGQLRIVWKHQPLSFHPQAVPAAIAAEAAHAQGKFWQMHDKLFEHQRELSPEKFSQWAREVGLDAKRFEADVASQAGKARIEADQQLAAGVGAQGTPTLFLNCRKVVGALPFETFKPIVEEELRKADALAAKGVRGAALYEQLCEDNVKTVAAAPTAAGSLPIAAPAPTQPVDAALVAREVRRDDPIRGSAKGRVTMLIFSDFECPFCGRALPTLKQIERTYGEDVRIVWKHQPLPFHQHALPAALAAEAAREQGKFWEMHDKIFENQATLGTETLQRLARELKLDLNRFNAAMQNPKLKERIQQDQALAARLGASGTPTFVIGGEKVVGAQPFEAFKAVIDRQLAATARR